MARLIICYRTEDASILTRQIVQHVRDVYQHWEIIEITEAQPYQELTNLDTVMLLIGAAWHLNIGQQQQWFNKPDDVLRMIVRTALAKPQIFVIPVLLNKTTAPQATELPVEFEKLVWQPFFACHRETFENDVNLLVHALRVRGAARRRSGRLGLIATIMLLLFFCGGTIAFIRTEAFQNFMTDTRRVMERLDPNSISAYLDQGWSNYTTGNYQQALNDFQKAISLQNNLVDAFDGLGWTYTKLNEIDKAQASFDRQVELAPFSLKSYAERGWFYWTIGNSQGAIADFEKVVQGSPNNEDVYMGLAQSYQAVEDYQKAADAFERVTQINPGNADAYRGLGESNDALGQNQLALQNYQRYLELAPAPDSKIAERVKQLQQG